VIPFSSALFTSAPRAINSLITGIFWAYGEHSAKTPYALHTSKIIQLQSTCLWTKVVYVPLWQALKLSFHPLPQHQYLLCHTQVVSAVKIFCSPFFPAQCDGLEPSHSLGPPCPHLQYCFARFSWVPMETNRLGYSHTTICAILCELLQGTSKCNTRVWYNIHWQPRSFQYYSHASHTKVWYGPSNVLVCLVLDIITATSSVVPKHFYELSPLLPTDSM